METEARWTVDQVLALAPDDSSRKAGARLATPAPWSGTGAAGSLVWGLCTGSGSRPYQTAVDVSGPAFRCTCPSRKFPCKHALGLLLRWAQGTAARGGTATVGGVDTAAVPDWVAQWSAARIGDEGSGAKGVGGAAAQGSAAPPPEPPGREAARRRAERRAVRVEGGAVELEQRLTDLLRGGLAGADRAGYQPWDEVAARMVDAQAPGLAARVRELAALPASGGDWPSRMLEEAGLLHLLARGYLGRERLPQPLVETVRTRIGFTVDTAEVLAGAAVRERWLVLSVTDTAEDRLTTRRIWLHAEGSGRFALLLSFGAAGRAPELVLPAGAVLDAELAYYPSAVPLRAALGTQYATEPGDGALPCGVGVAAALDSYGAALADDPWLDAWPVVLSGVVPIPSATRWQLADATGEEAVPLAGAASHWRLAALSGGHPLTVFAEVTPAGARPLAAWPAPSTPPVSLTA
jgi:hypothetical protein